MFEAQIYIDRRVALRRSMTATERGGVVLIAGNTDAPNSYPSNTYYFRQDSSFRYLFGLTRPSLWGVIDLDSGEDILFGAQQSLDDIIWMGAQPSLEEQSQLVGVTTTFDLQDLKKYIAKAKRLGRKIHTLPPYRGETKIELRELLGGAIDQYVSTDLIFAMAALRERKGAEEIAELEASYAIGYQMHTRAMAMCRAGVIEREIGGALEGIARSQGAGVSFTPICTQHGETLHNVDREGVLQDGRLFLCDAGAETLEGYCSDHTRTYPIGGRFSPIQRDIYKIVLAAHQNTARVARAGVLYRDLHRACYLRLAEGLRDVGLVRGAAEDIVESGAMTLFMPHGLSHGIGLDVHDCEAYGERSITLPPNNATSCIVRKEWRLEEGTVLSNEPGVYFIPALIEQRRSKGLYRGVVDYARVAALYDFGGIRVEDDLVIDTEGARQIGSTYDKQIPTTVEQIEEFIKLHQS
ncbi:MAG: aminopeptidase P family protein [Rikenellaceae bacterium]